MAKGQGFAMAAFNATGSTTSLWFCFQHDHPCREAVSSSDPKTLDMSIRFRFEQKLQ